MAGKKSVVYGVFDWGLGHATRSKPLIEALLEANCSVDIITTGRALLVLREHFGGAIGNYHDVPSVASPYVKTRHFCLNFIMKSPDMLSSLRKARKLSKKIIKKNDYDLVISDCRYDVYGNKKSSYLINHQLRFEAPLGGELPLELWLAYRMNRYAKVFVPDFAGDDNLSGKLSHKMKFLKKKKLVYLGPVSHVQRKKCEKDIDCFIMLTGPEPQRGILEAKVLEQVKKLEGKIVVVGGNPDGGSPDVPKGVEYHSFIQGEQLREYLNRSKFIVTRSGYTSMMEFVELGIDKALLIPTPGQTEQEYLAEFYKKKGYYYSVDQDHLDLARDIRMANGFSGFPIKWRTKKSVKLFMKAIGL